MGILTLDMQKSNLEAEVTNEQLRIHRTDTGNGGKFHCVVELQDAIAMAHAILAAAAEVEAQQADEDGIGAMLRRYEDAQDVAHMAVSSGWGHD